MVCHKPGGWAGAGGALRHLRLVVGVEPLALAGAAACALAALPGMRLGRAGEMDGEGGGRWFEVHGVSFVCG